MIVQEEIKLIVDKDTETGKMYYRIRDYRQRRIYDIHKATVATYDNGHYYLRFDDYGVD